MSWKFASPIVSLLAVILILWFHARREGKIRTAIDRGDGSVEFTPDLVSILPMSVLGLLPAWDIYNRHGSGSLMGEFNLAVILFVVGVLLFNLPGTIIVAHDGIARRYWLRGAKRIRWGEIAEIKNGKFAGMLLFIGSDGTKIVYTEKLGDRPRFLEEIEKHAPGRLPPEVRAGSVLNLHSARRSGWLGF